MSFVNNIMQYANMGYTLNSFLVQCLEMSQSPLSRYRAFSTPASVNIDNKLSHFKQQMNALVIDCIYQGKRLRTDHITGDTPLAKKERVVRPDFGWEISSIVPNNSSSRESVRLREERVRNPLANPLNQGGSLSLYPFGKPPRRNPVRRSKPKATGGLDLAEVSMMTMDVVEEVENEVFEDTVEQDPIQGPVQVSDNTVPSDTNNVPPADGGNHAGSDEHVPDIGQAPGGGAPEGGDGPGRGGPGDTPGNGGNGPAGILGAGPPTGDQEEHILITLTRCLFRLLSLILNNMAAIPDGPQDAIRFDLYGELYAEVFDDTIIQRMKDSMGILGLNVTELTAGPNIPFYTTLGHLYMRLRPSEEVHRAIKTIMAQGEHDRITTIMKRELATFSKATPDELNNRPVLLVQLMVHSALIWIKLLAKQDVLVSSLMKAVQTASSRLEDISDVANMSEDRVLFAAELLQKCKQNYQEASTYFVGIVHGMYVDMISEQTMSAERLNDYLYITANLFSIERVQFTCVDEIIRTAVGMRSVFFFDPTKARSFNNMVEAEDLAKAIRDMDDKIQNRREQLSRRDERNVLSTPNRQQQTRITGVSGGAANGDTGTGIPVPSFHAGRNSVSGSNAAPLGPFNAGLSNLAGSRGGRSAPNLPVNEERERSRTHVQLTALQTQLYGVMRKVSRFPAVVTVDPADKDTITSYLVRCDVLSDQCDEIRKTYHSLIGKPDFLAVHVEHEGEDQELNEVANLMKEAVKTFRHKLNDIRDCYKKKLESQMKSLNKSMTGLKIVKIKHDYELLGFYDQLSRLLARTFNEQTEFDMDTLLVTISDAATVTLRSELVGVKTLQHAIQTVARHLYSGSNYLNALIRHLAVDFKPKITDKSQPQTSLARSQLEKVGKVLGEFKNILRHRSLFARMTCDHVQQLFVIIFGGLGKLEQATSRRAAFMAMPLEQRQNLIDRLKAKCNDHNVMSEMNVTLSPELMYQGNNTSIIDTNEITVREVHGFLNPTDFQAIHTDSTPMDDFLYLVIILEAMRGHLQESIPNLTIQDGLNNNMRRMFRPVNGLGYQRYHVNGEEQGDDSDVDLLSDTMNTVAIDDGVRVSNNRKLKGKNKTISPLHQQQKKNVDNKPAVQLKHPCLLPSVCHEHHSRPAAWACPVFKAKAVEDRWQLVRKHGLCFQCLRSHRTQLPCPTPTICPRCQMKHNTLLCDQLPSNTTNNRVTGKQIVKVVKKNKPRVQRNNVELEEIDAESQEVTDEDEEEEVWVNNVEVTEDAEVEDDMDAGTKAYLEAIKSLLFELVGIVKVAKAAKSKSMTNTSKDTSFEKLGNNFDELVTFCLNVGLENVERNTVTQCFDAEREIGSDEIRESETFQVVSKHNNYQSIYCVPISVRDQVQTLVRMVRSYLMYCGVSENYEITLNDDLRFNCKDALSFDNSRHFYAMNKHGILNIPSKDVCFNPNKPVNKTSVFMQISPQAKLFSKVFNVSTRIHTTFPMRMLNVAVVRIILGDASRVEYYQEQFKTLQDTHVEIYGRYSTLLSPVLIDSGACSSSGLKCLTELLDCKVLGKVTYNECTPAGSRVRTDQKIVISILDDAGRIINVPTVTVDHLGKSQPMPEPLIDIICADLNVSKRQLFDSCGIFFQSVQPYFLLGNNIRQTRHTSINDFKSVCMPRSSIFNPNMSLVYSEISVNKYFLISGSFGIDPALLDVSRNTPILMLPGDITEEIIDNVAAKINRILDIYERYRSYDPRTDTVSNLHLRQDQLSRFTYCEEERPLVTLDHMNNVTSLPDYHMFNLIRGMTRFDSSQVADFVLSEAALLLTSQYCSTHDTTFKKTTENCDECLALTCDPHKLSHIVLHNDIWKNMYLVEVSPGIYKVFQKLVFLEPISIIGSLYNNNVQEAVRSSVSLFKKVTRLKELKSLHEQFMQRIDKKWLRRATTEEMKKILAGQLPCNFVRRTLAYKPTSTTTAVRLVCDPSAPIQFLANNLSEVQRAPRVNLVNMSHMILRFYLSPILLSSDVEKAYLMINLDESNHNLFGTVWFYEPEKYAMKYPEIYFSTVAEFGLGSSSTSLSVAMHKYVYPAMTNDAARAECIKNTYVDNIDLHTANDIEQVLTWQKDLDQACAKHSFKISKYYFPHSYLETCPALAEYMDERGYILPTETTTYGKRWFLGHDTYLPHYVHSKYGKQKGRPLGPPLDKEPLLPNEVTRRLCARLLSQSFDPSGRAIGLIISGGKYILNQVCNVVPRDELDAPLINWDVDIANEAARYWNEVAQTVITPYPRAVVPVGFKISKIICNHDGGAQLIGSHVHIVSTDGISQHCYILATKSQVSAATVPVNELKSRGLAFSLLNNIFTGVSEEIRNNCVENLEIIIINDSLPNTYLYKPRQNFKNVLQRNIRRNTESQMELWMSLLPGVTIYLCWVPSSLLTSDLSSKLHRNLEKNINSKFYRRGHNMYIREELKTFCFLMAKNNEFHYSQLPSMNGCDDCPSFTDIVNKVTHVLPGGMSVQNTKEQRKYNVSSEDMETSVPSPCPVYGDMSCVSSGPEDTMVHTAAYYHDNIDSSEVECFYNISTKSSPDYYDPLPINTASLAAYLVNSRLLVHPVQVTEDSVMINIDTRSKQRPAAGGGVTVFFTRQHLSTSLPPLFLEDTSIIHFSEDLYYKMVTKHRNILTTLNTYCRILDFVQRIKKKLNRNKSLLSVKQITAMVWRSFLYHDQLYSKLDYRGTNSDTNFRFEVMDRIRVVRLRDTNEVIPVLSRDSPLLENLIWTHHLEGLRTEVNMQLHHPHKTVKNRLGHCSLAVFSSSYQFKVSNVLSKCTGCAITGISKLRYLCTYGTSKLAEVYGKAFASSAVDIVGPFLLKPHKDSRASKILYYLLFCACKATGAVDAVPLEGISATDVIHGLTHLQYKNNVIFESIDCDAGKQFSAACLSSKTTLPFKLNQMNTKSQYQNYAEAKFRVFTDLYKRLFHKNKDSDGKYSLLITPCDFGRLTDCLVLTINSIPYSHNQPLLAPYVNKYPASIVNILSEDGTIKGDETSRFGQYLQSLYQLRNDILKDQLQTRASHPTHRFHSGINRYIKKRPSEGDLVLHLFGSQHVICVITKIIDKNSCIIRRGRKEYTVNIANLEIVALADDTM